MVLNGCLVPDGATSRRSDDGYVGTPQAALIRRKSLTIGVGRIDYIPFPLPPNRTEPNRTEPNRTGGSPAYGSPFSGVPLEDGNGTLFDGLLAVGGKMKDTLLHAHGDGDHGDHGDLIIHHD